MVTAYQTILVLLILQMYVRAAPNSTIEPEDAAKIENEKSNLDSLPSPLEESKKDGNTNEDQRQKRSYQHYGHRYPPIRSVQYPTYNKRLEDLLNQIHKQLQEIASFARQPPPPLLPGVPNYFPYYFPIFVPQYCACGPNTDTLTLKPDITPPATQPPVNGETNTPDIFKRGPEIKDGRKNWVVGVNKTDGINEDFSRPISFDPIVWNSTMSRPAPRVEHGSIQASTRPNQRPTSTTFGSPLNQWGLHSPSRSPKAVIVGTASFTTSGPNPVIREKLRRRTTELS